MVVQYSFSNPSLFCPRKKWKRGVFDYKRKRLPRRDILLFHRRCGRTACLPWVILNSLHVTGSLRLLVAWISLAHVTEEKARRRPNVGELPHKCSYCLVELFGGLYRLFHAKSDHSGISLRPDTACHLVRMFVAHIYHDLRQLTTNCPI